jgi:hypothetical protein
VVNQQGKEKTKWNKKYASKYWLIDLKLPLLSRKKKKVLPHS